MELELSINGVIKSLDVTPNESLLTLLRREGYYSVKRGCESGECGACAVLVDGVSRPSCVTLAAQAGGCSLMTVESLGNSHKLHPLQEAFIDTGAVQCGFCTSGMLLSAYALLKKNPAPEEEEVRQALSGNLCLCTGYVKPVQAILRAAAIMRGDAISSVSLPPASESLLSQPSDLLPLQGNTQIAAVRASSTPSRALASRPDQTDSTLLVKARPTSELALVGKSVRQVDAIKLVTGKAAFADDIAVSNMLHARLLTSPHAHAVIREIDTSEAMSLSGVHAILTYKDLPRLPSATDDLSASQQGARDQPYAQDSRVRFVGDRVAVIAAETAEVAEQALKLIHVDYELLPVVLDPRLATSSQAPSLHPEQESRGIHAAEQNVAAYLQAEIGNVESGFAQSDLIIDGEYTAPQVQQTSLENHIVITYWDENERMVVRTSTAVPHHVRRTLASLIDLPPGRIRVVRSNIGGNPGVKQEVLIEDLCALLTMATARPVRLAYSRAEEFSSGHSRPSHIIRMKTGVKRDGTIVANSMTVVANTGAYSSYADAETVLRNTGASALSLYPCPHQRFEGRAIYTNLPPSGAFTGYGVPQGFFALESHIDEIARQLGLDSLDVRRKNCLKVGDDLLIAQKLYEGQEDSRQKIQQCELLECLSTVAEHLQWKEKHGHGGDGRFRRGVGLSLTMHSATSISGSMTGASIKLNEDGTFNVLVEAIEHGTIIAQIVAEILGVQIEDILLHLPDTDVTPLNTGASASSTVFVSVGAARKAAEQVRTQILAVAGHILKTNPEQLTIRDRVISGPAAEDQKTVTLSQVALHSLYIEQPIMIAAFWKSSQVPPSFAAQGAEVEVDIETGVVRVTRILSAVDVGRTINPTLTIGQIEGGMAQALGYGLCEELLYSQHGEPLTTNLRDYRIPGAPDMPAIETYLVETSSSDEPFGSRSSAEISVNALAPAIANAVADALGVRLRQIPLTPERVLRVLRAQVRGGSEKKTS